MTTKEELAKDLEALRRVAEMSLGNGDYYLSMENLQIKHRLTTLIITKEAQIEVLNVVCK